MLASDFEDVTELVEDYLKDHTVEELYDEVVMPGLMMAEADRHAGELDASREAFILEHTHDLIDDLCSRELPAPQIAKAAETKSGKIEAPAKGSKAEAKKTEHVERVEKAGEVDPQQQAVDREMARQMVSVAIVPARDPADELVGRMLAHLLELRGVGAKPLSAERLSGERLEAVAKLKVGVVCVSALPPQAVTHARFMGKRLRGLLPEAKIVVGLWRVRGDAAKLRSAVTAQASDSVATTLAQALEFIVPLAMAKISDAMLPAPIPANESERLKELRRLDLLSPGTDETLEAAAKDLAKIFDAPIAMASVIDEKRQVWKGQVGLPDQLAKRTESPRDTSICGHVAAVNHTLVVEDASRDKRFANNPVVKEQDIRFYAGAPLRTKSGQAIGVLCVIDHRPCTFTERDRSIMQAIADHAMRDIEKRHRSDVISELTSGIKTMITGEIPQPKPGNT
jgi:GAF domain-containing protein